MDTMTRISVYTVFVLVFSLLCLACCGGTKIVKRPYAEPSVDVIFSYLAKQGAQGQSYRAESVMDYWVDDERVKGTVLMMGKRGAKARFNALNPTGDMVAVDMACNGDTFRYVNYNENCVLEGPCNKDSIAQLLRVSLRPDDFLLLAIGATPLISHAEKTLSWDEKSGREVLLLKSHDGWTQKITLGGKEGAWTVVSSHVKDPKGKTEWHLENKGIRSFKGEDAKTYLVPTKTRFKQPKYKADLLVIWNERRIGAALGDEKFQLELPGGLSTCQ